MTMLSVISSYSHNDVTTGSVADPDLQISAGGGGGCGCSLRDKEGCRSYIYIHTCFYYYYYYYYLESYTINGISTISKLLKLQTRKIPNHIWLISY